MAKIENENIFIEEGDSGNYILTVTDKLTHISASKIFKVVLPFKGSILADCSQTFLKYAAPVQRKYNGFLDTMSISLDGYRVIYCGPYGKNNTTKSCRIQFNKAGTVNFKYALSTESSYDKLSIKRYDENGNLQEVCLNNVSGGSEYKEPIFNDLEITFEDEDYLIISYTKDNSESKGWDTVFFAIPFDIATNITNEYDPSSEIVRISSMQSKFYYGEDELNVIFQHGDFIAKTIPSFDEVTQSALELKLYSLADEPGGLNMVQRANPIYSSATGEITDTNLKNNFIIEQVAENQYSLESPNSMSAEDEQTYANLIRAEWKDNTTQTTATKDFYFLFDKNYNLSTNKNLSAFMCNNWTVMRAGATYPGFIPSTYTLNDLGFGSLLNNYTVLKPDNVANGQNRVMFIRFNTAGTYNFKYVSSDEAENDRIILTLHDDINSCTYLPDGNVNKKTMTGENKDNGLVTHLQDWSITASEGNILVANYTKDSGGSHGYQSGFLLVPKSATIEYYNDPNGNVE